MKLSDLEAEYSYVTAARRDAREAERARRAAAIAAGKAKPIADVAPAAEQLAAALGGKVKRRKKTTTTGDE